MYSSNPLISEVEKNQKLLLEGDVLFYIDSENCQKWTVLEVSKTGFLAIDDHGFEDHFLFSDLQLGWCISDKTKDIRYNERRYRYAS